MWSFKLEISKCNIELKIMTSDSLAEDLHLAQKICRELLAQNTYAINALYQKFHRMFIQFARQRLYGNDKDQAESVLTTFWMTLLNPKPICSYEAKGSLKSYLIIILYRRIVDQNRIYKRRQEKEENIEPDHAGLLMEEKNSPSPEDGTVNREQTRKQNQIIDEALSMLEKYHPKDADLIRMRLLEELPFKEIAQKLLKGRQASELELSKKENSLRKQFTRKNGANSQDRFRVCLDRCLKKHKLTRDDVV